MTPLPPAVPAKELIAALESAMAQLSALTSGDDDAFLAGLAAHQSACLALEAVRLGPGDRTALEQLISVNSTIMSTLAATQDTLRVQMNRGRDGTRAATAYLAQ